MSSKIFRRGWPLIFVFALCVHSTQAQTANERHGKIRAAVESKDYASAINDLQSMRRDAPSVFTSNNYDYLLARMSEKRGDAAAAAVIYQAVVERNSMLTQYALWHLSQLARATGNLTLEREQLRQLVTLAPTSLLRDAATARLGQSYFESGDYAAAIEVLRPRGKATGGASAREALALIGQAYLKSNQKDAAREVFNTLISQLPNPAQPDDFALAAVRGLDILDSGSVETAQQSAPQLAEAEHLRRAFVYNFNRDFDGARRHYQALIKGYDRSANLADALYQMGRTFYQERRFDEAINYFNRVITQFPESANARDALSYTASSYVRMKRTDEAVAAYRRFIERYPDAPSPERSFLNIIDALREVGRDAEALDWVNQTRARFRGQAGDVLALFEQARIHLAQNNWTAALADLDALKSASDLGGMRVPGGTSVTELAFTRGYVLEQMGRTDEAISAYLSIPDGRSEYYGGRATRRLRALAVNQNTSGIIGARFNALRADAQQSISSGQAERARQSAQSALRLTEDATLTRELLDIARRAYAALPAYNIASGQLLPFGRQNVISESVRENPQPSHKTLADELLFLGLYDEGAPELAVAENAFGSSQNSESSTSNSSASISSTSNSSTSLPRDQAYTLAVLYKRGEHAARAITYAEPLWKKAPGDYLIELAPREFVELLYPAPYSSALMEYAPSRNVDPRFVLAIARQESRFRPEAKSVSAARGLMQFIPSTASDIAAQLGLQNFNQDDLYNPRIAILFGSQYMGNLFKQFPDMPQAVAASYNGGEDNVARWVARARSNDPDRYVLEIGFTQAKDYVFKVTPNFWAYQTLYSDQLQRR